MTEALDISVVIATHNRASRLSRLVDGLASQEGVRFEVVLVDDASTDSTWEELDRLAGAAPFSLRPLRLTRNSGAAAARNAGWRAAGAPLVAFTDDDCVPQPGWLEALVGHLADSDLVQGQTRPNPDQIGNQGPFSRTIDVTREFGYYETCNMGYRRHWLERVNGFDEQFRYPYGEDADLAWRIKDAGGTSYFAPEALVYHDIWPSDYRAHLRDRVRREGLVLALKKHPRLRRARGVFQNGAHPAALVALAGGAAFLMKPSTTRLGLAAALGLPYVWACRKYNPSPPRKVQWLVVLPLHLVADSYEVSVLARASLRYRTLVL